MFPVIYTRTRVIIISLLLVVVTSHIFVGTVSIEHVFRLIGRTLEVLVLTAEGARMAGVFDPL